MIATGSVRGLLTCFLTGCVSIAATAQDVTNTRMLENPAISKEHIAFSYDGDLWVANRDGNNPR
ncbi:MAG: hypothetical protein ABL888_09245, partial [Pirellulaceae bacterium]